MRAPTIRYECKPTILQHPIIMQHIIKSRKMQKIKVETKTLDQRRSDHGRSKLGGSPATQFKAPVGLASWVSRDPVVDAQNPFLIPQNSFIMH